MRTILVVVSVALLTGCGNDTPKENVYEQRKGEIANSVKKEFLPVATLKVVTSHRIVHVPKIYDFILEDGTRCVALIGNDEKDAALACDFKKQ